MVILETLWLDSVLVNCSIYPEFCLISTPLCMFWWLSFYHHRKVLGQYEPLRLLEIVSLVILRHIYCRATHPPLLKDTESYWKIVLNVGTQSTQIQTLNEFTQLSKPFLFISFFFLDFVSCCVYCLFNVYFNNFYCGTYVW